MLLGALPLIAVDIALTLDDYPFLLEEGLMEEGPIFSVQERTKAFIIACEKHSCKAAFFCVGCHCIGKDGLSLLAELDKKGHFLSNHSMKHTHLSSQSLEDFREEIIQVDKILVPYKNMRRWYRYPYLDYGNRPTLGGSRAKTFQSLEVLNNLGYTEGYVTINTFDWYINSRLSKTINNGGTVDYDALKDVYIQLLKTWCEYYIQLYDNTISEKITHTLLFHANDLNALFLEEILEMIKDSGWHLVSPELAFENINWRRKILKNPEIIMKKPKTLSCFEIDKLLQSHNTFH